MSKLANLNLIRWSFKIDKQIYRSPEGPYLAVAFFCCRFFFLTALYFLCCLSGNKKIAVTTK